jgi:hypothetical protein
MEPSRAKELIGLLSERSIAWQSLWNVFYTVAGAIVTLILSGKLPGAMLCFASSVSTIVFLLFAVGNYRSLNELRKQREALIDFVIENAEGNPHIKKIARAAAPPTPSGLKIYHWGLSILVVVLLWIGTILQ